MRNTARVADAKVKYVYHGPPVFVVELQQEVTDGDEVTGSDALEHAFGFERVQQSSRSARRDEGGDE